MPTDKGSILMEDTGIPFEEEDIELIEFLTKERGKDERGEERKICNWSGTVRRERG